jgi:hypothetical protein
MRRQVAHICSIARQICNCCGRSSAVFAIPGDSAEHGTARLKEAPEVAIHACQVQLRQLLGLLDLHIYVMVLDVLQDCHGWLQLRIHHNDYTVLSLSAQSIVIATYKSRCSKIADPMAQATERQKGVQLSWGQPTARKAKGGSMAGSTTAIT